MTEGNREHCSNYEPSYTYLNRYTHRKSLKRIYLVSLLLKKWKEIKTIQKINKKIYTVNQKYNFYKKQRLHSSRSPGTRLAGRCRFGRPEPMDFLCFTMDLRVLLWDLLRELPFCPTAYGPTNQHRLNFPENWTNLRKLKKRLTSFFLKYKIKSSRYS